MARVTPSRRIADLIPPSVITNEFWGLPLFVSLFAVTFTLWVFLISISQSIGADILPFAIVFTFLSAIFWLIDPLLKEYLPVHAANIILVAIYLISSQYLLVVSGGFHSQFFLAYYFVVLTGAMAYGLSGAVIVTGLIAVAYYDFVESPIQYPEYALKMIVLWIVALMVGFLAETKRRVEQREMRQSLRIAALTEVARFMRELSAPQDVVNAGLEALVRLLGARTAMLLTPNGRVVASHGAAISTVPTDAFRLALWEEWLAASPQDEMSDTRRELFGAELVIDRGGASLTADEERIVRLLMEKVQLTWIHLEDKMAIDQIRAEKELVFDSIGSAVLRIAADHTVRSANRRAGEILALEERSSIGSTLSELGVVLPPLEDAGALPREAALTDAQGRTIPVEMRVMLCHDENGVEDGWIVVLDDLQELRRLKSIIRRSEALAAVGELAARVAHEIRNPLGGILGFLGLAERKAGPEIKTYIGEAKLGVSRLDRIVKDLLTFARPGQAGTGSFALSDAWVSLERMETQALEDDAAAGGALLGEGLPPAGRSHCHVRIEPLAMSLVGVRLKSDAALFAQVLTNLVRNAREAAGENGHVTVRARPGDPHVWFEVDDSGPGWPPDVADRLFEPFVSTKTEGSGLGLAIARRIVEELGGGIRGLRVDLASPSKASGTAPHETVTRFRVAWPLAVNPPSSALPAAGVAKQTLRREVKS